MKHHQSFFWIMVIAVSLAIAPTAVQAHVLTVTDGNSEIDVDPHSEDGLDFWEVDGIEHMFQQWYWFRVEGDDSESSLDTLPLSHHETHGSDTIHITYSVLDDLGSPFGEVNLEYRLTGGPEGTSKIEEWFTFGYSGLEEAETVHIFEYTDLDLDDSSGGDSAELVEPGIIVQSDGDVFVTVESDIVPDHWEIAEYSDLLDDLTDGAPTTLGDTGSPFGPADATHAFQYTFLLPAGDGGFEFHKEKVLGDFPEDGPPVIPEPSSMLLFGFGSAAAWVARRRKRA